MLFSVIIAVRNEVSIITRCIESVMHQDIKQTYEVLVVDGLSTDGTYELLQNLQKKFDFILLRNEKINAAAGRNLGIQHSSGKYLAFVDGDAIPRPNWLSMILQTFQKNPEVIGVGGPDLLPSDSTPKETAIGHIMTSPIARGGRFNPSTQHSLMKDERYVDHIPTCNLSLKRDVFNKVGLFDESFVKGQDLELNYRIIKAGYKLLYKPGIAVVHYRKNHVRSFSRQIYKWAKAKVAIIRKHGFDGIISHIYLWPIYAVMTLLISFLLFLSLNLVNIYIFLLILMIIGYSSIILFESGRLMRKFHNRGLLVYGALLLPLLHLAYGWGVLSAIIHRKIW